MVKETDATSRKLEIQTRIKFISLSISFYIPLKTKSATEKGSKEMLTKEGTPITERDGCKTDELQVREV